MYVYKRQAMENKRVDVKGELRNKIPLGKNVITNRDYGAQAEPEDYSKLLLPNPMDTPELAIFKARVRARHETFNGRLKFFSSLNDTYHHSWASHVHVVTVIYQQMDNGAEIFAA